MLGAKRRDKAGSQALRTPSPSYRKGKRRDRKAKKSIGKVQEEESIRGILDRSWFWHEML